MGVYNMMRGTGSFDERQEFVRMASKSLIAYRNRVIRGIPDMPVYKKAKPKRKKVKLTPKLKKQFKHLGHLPTDKKYYSETLMKEPR